MKTIKKEKNFLMLAGGMAFFLGLLSLAAFLFLFWIFLLTTTILVGGAVIFVLEKISPLKERIMVLF